MKRLILFACLVFGFYCHGLSQNPLGGNSGYGIQNYKFYWNNSSDSIMRIATWGVKFFKSIYVNKDSIPLIQSTASESVALVDTITGKVKRIPSAKLFNQIQIDSLGYYTITGTTTDATPTNLIVIPVSIGYAISIEATCIAITADGDDAFSGIKHRAYHKTSGGTLTSLALTTIAPDAYVGGGLSAATFTLTNSGTDAAIQVTGEAATTINWKIRYKLVSINVSF